MIVLFVRGRVTRTFGLVDKVQILVIASDQRERGNLKLQVVQRIEIATARKARLAMTLTRVCQHSRSSGLIDLVHGCVGS